MGIGCFIIDLGVLVVNWKLLVVMGIVEIGVVVKVNGYGLVFDCVVVVLVVVGVCKFFVVIVEEGIVVW